MNLLKKTGVRLIVGKGGMGPETARACKETLVHYTVYSLQVMPYLLLQKSKK